MLTKRSHTFGLLLLCIALAGSCFAATSPVAVLTLESPEAVLGESVRLACRIQWTGDVNAFRVHPAEVGAWAQGDVHLESMEWSSAGDQQEVIQWLVLSPAQLGAFSTPEITIPYELADQPSTEATPALVLSPEPVSLTVSEPFTVPQAAYWALVVVLLLLIGMGYLFLRRSRVEEVEPEESLEQQLQEALHAARQKRLDGDFYTCYQSLHRLARQLPKDQESETHQRLAGLMEDRMKAVGFQGHHPTDDELDGDFKEVEQALKVWMNSQTRDESL